MSLRFNTYGTAIKETFSSSFGLGFGPGSFSNYFGALNSTNLLLNPHSLWIEIFFQYGIIVFTRIFSGVSICVHSAVEVLETDAISNLCDDSCNGCNSCIHFICSKQFYWLFVFMDSNWANDWSCYEGKAELKGVRQETIF